VIALVLMLAAAIGSLPRVYTPDTSVEGYTKVPPPNIRMRMNEASATTVPWIDSNASRYMRGVKKAFYAKLPAGSAPLAAAEAFAYGIDAILEPAPDDKQALDTMLEFLRRVDAHRMPMLANIGIVDDGSPEMAEVLNLLSRRNLLYRVVTAPDPKLDLNIRIGSEQYPRDAVKNPNDFAARVREKLTDDKRLVRLFNTYTVIVNLTGENGRARLHVLNYARRPAKDIRVRVLGEYKQVKLHEAADATMAAQDVIVADRGTEFTIPQIATYAVIDLESKSK
jgi:hypothetical protein